MSEKKEPQLMRIFPLKRRRRKEMKEDPDSVANTRFQCLVALKRFRCLVALERFHCLMALKGSNAWWPMEGSNV
jgi:hypothetical protein